jgi:hypothetical protein
MSVPFPEVSRREIMVSDLAQRSAGRGSRSAAFSEFNRELLRVRDLPRGHYASKLCRSISQRSNMGSQGSVNFPEAISG